MKTTLRFKLSALVSMLAIFGMSTSFAYANDPVVTISYLQVGEIQYPPGSNIILPTLPIDTTIVGEVFYDGPGKLNGVELSAFVNFEEIYRESLRGTGSATDNEYNIPWTITSFGAYFVEIIATTQVKGNPQKCKAAPALAAQYVRENPELFAPGVMAKVGKETGINGQVSAKDKCEFDYYVETVEILLEE